MRTSCLAMTIGITLLLFCDGQPTAAQGTKEYTPKSKRFTIQMPPGQKTGQRTQQITINQIQIPVEAAYTDTKKGGPKYLVASIGIPAAALREVPAELRFSTFRDAILKPIKGRITAEQDIKQGNVPGKEYQIDTATGAARMHLYLQGDFVIYAYVESRAQDDVKSKRADDFFGSFKMTPELVQDNVGMPAGGNAKAAAGDNQPRTAEDVVKKLQGTWEIVRMEKDGGAMPATMVRALPTLTFQGKDFTFAGGGTGTIVAIDANKSPITIDYKYTSGPRNGELEFAIVRFDGDTFIDCMPAPGGDRPNQFSTVQGGGRLMQTYQPTAVPRGPGNLFNPWFYIGICAAAFIGLILFIALIVGLVLWAFRSSKSKEKQSRGRRRIGREED